MPQNLIDANKDYATLAPDPETGELRKRIDKKTRKAFIVEREAYRMKPKGRPDKDGYQRFMYPTPGSYMAIDRATGKRVAKPVTPATITIPLDAGSPTTRGENPRLAVKHIQKFPYKSREHRKYFGMRSLVEAANKHIKEKNFEDIANVSKRSGRGFAFNYLAASNLRKIFKFFIKDAERTLKAKLPRERHRKSATGMPLAAHSTLPALAPPR
jgi:hypothetical protein